MIKPQNLNLKYELLEQAYKTFPNLMKAGTLGSNNSSNNTIVTRYRNSNPNDMSVRKDNRKSTRDPISTYSKAEDRINPQSTEVDESDVELILCYFQN